MRMPMRSLGTALAWTVPDVTKTSKRTRSKKQLPDMELRTRHLLSRGRTAMGTTTRVLYACRFSTDADVRLDAFQPAGAQEASIDDFQLCTGPLPNTVGMPRKTCFLQSLAKQFETFDACQRNAGECNTIAEPRLKQEAIGSPEKCGLTHEG